MKGKYIDNKKSITTSLSLDPSRASWTGITKEQVKKQLEGWGEWKELNIINQGDATTKILKIITPEIITTILRIYRITKRLRDHKNYSDLPQKSTFPIKDVNQIKSILLKLQEEGWLFKEDIAESMKYITKGIKGSPKGRKALYGIRKETRKQEEKLRRPADEPLNFAIYLLTKQLKAKSGKPNWSLMGDFLDEQKEDFNIDYTYEQVRDRYRKIDKRKIPKQYQYYRDLYLYPLKNIYDGRSFEDIKIVRTAHFKRDIILPVWSELLPDSKGKN